MVRESAESRKLRMKFKKFFRNPQYRKRLQDKSSAEDRKLYSDPLFIAESRFFEFLSNYGQNPSEMFKINMLRRVPTLYIPWNTFADAFKQFLKEYQIALNGRGKSKK